MSRHIQFGKGTLGQWSKSNKAVIRGTLEGSWFGAFGHSKLALGHALGKTKARWPSCHSGLGATLAAGFRPRAEILRRHDAMIVPQRTEAVVMLVI